MNKIYFSFNFSSDPFKTNRLRWFVLNGSIEVNPLKWIPRNEPLKMKSTDGLGSEFQNASMAITTDFKQTLNSNEST